MARKGEPEWFDMGETEYRASQICRVLEDLESLVGEIRRQDR